MGERLKRSLGITARTLQARLRWHVTFRSVVGELIPLIRFGGGSDWYVPHKPIILNHSVLIVDEPEL
jgi:hypothetical protein